jgi:hypothetical protein
MSKYKNYTDEDICLAVKNSKSIAQVLRLLDLVPVGGNYQTIKQKIATLNLDTSHFTGQAWIPKGSHVKSFDKLTGIVAVKKRLIEERGHKCERCHLSSWNELPLALEMDHIDGNRQDNSRENLRLLCPNCHSQTKTWRRRKMAAEEPCYTIFTFTPPGAHDNHPRNGGWPME